MAKVLVVDDSPTQTLMYQRMLTRGGHQVLQATNGADGFEIAKREQPDLILMDVVMPGVNGFQATRELTKSKETTNIPIIVVSSKDQDTDKLWALRQGARDYFVKSVKEKDLIKRIDMLLAE